MKTGDREEQNKNITRQNIKNLKRYMFDRHNFPSCATQVQDKKIRDFEAFD